jgi:hypothetical protein
MLQLRSEPASHAGNMRVICNLRRDSPFTRGALDSLLPRTGGKGSASGGRGFRRRHQSATGSRCRGVRQTCRSVGMGDYPAAAGCPVIDEPRPVEPVGTEREVSSCHRGMMPPPWRHVFARVGRLDYAKIAKLDALTVGTVGRSQAVRQRTLNPPYGGSNPPAPANLFTAIESGALLLASSGEDTPVRRRRDAIAPAGATADLAASRSGL